METASLQKDKAIRLFTYLKELSLLKTPLIRDIRQYESFIFLNEIPNEPECLSPLFADSKDLWIQIKKPAKPAFPEASEDIIPWMNTSFKPGVVDEEPKLLDKIPNPQYEENELDDEATSDDPLPYFFIEDFPDIQAEFESYMTNRWIPWRNEAIRYETIQEIYSMLFSLYQKQKKLGEQYELLVGAGLLNWQSPEKQIVHRHVLMIPCQFGFDSSKGIISVIPLAQGPKAELEQDMLELDSRLDNKALAPLKEILEELQGDIWKKSLLDSLFRSFVFSLSANGTYLMDEYNPIKQAGKEPNITYSPALILRKALLKVNVDKLTTEKKQWNSDYANLHCFFSVVGLIFLKNFL